MGSARKPIRSLLIATDFSSHSERALELGIDLALQLGARVRLLHAYDLPLTAVRPYTVTMPDPYIEACHAAAAEKLAEALEQVRAAGVEADSRLSEVPAAGAIVAEAEASGCDLIVMGTRGNGGIKHMLLGSVAERTLRAAPCPVLTVAADRSEAS
jgi:nucleotide-binding universal stress UspA family protein